MRSLGLTILVYLVVSGLLCGGPIMPIAFLTSFHDRLGVADWRLLVVAGGLIAALMSFAASYFWKTVRYALPLFVGLWMVLSAALVGGYATYLRAAKVAEFQPESYIGWSFISSLRNAPADFQVFVHALALKDCKPYAWSYREMAFYELPAGVAVDLGDFPREWLERCSIHRVD